MVRSTPAQAPRYDADHYDYRMPATDDPGKRMTPLHGRIVARDLGQFPDFIRHAGQEFGMVLSGAVRIHFETGESIVLKRQESAYFDSAVGHIYLSVSKADAQVVVMAVGCAAPAPRPTPAPGCAAGPRSFPPGPAGPPA